MRVIALGNDYVHQGTTSVAEPAVIEEKPAGAVEEKVKEVKQYDNHPAAGAKEPEPVEQKPQADTQEPAKEETAEKKKGKDRKAQK